MHGSDQRAFNSRVDDLLLGVPLRELSDETLAEQILTAGATSPDVVSHRDELLRRHRHMIVRRAQRACSRLAHAGWCCPGRGCDEALPSGVGAIGEQLAGRRVLATIGARGSLEVAALLADGRRRPPGLSVLRGWINEIRLADGSPNANGAVSSVPSLARYFGGSLVRAGIDTDVRRRWNTDRGLLQRLQPSARFCEAWFHHLAELDGRADAGDDPTAAAAVLDLLDNSKLGRNPRAWVGALYDDACDVPSHDVTRGHDIQRLCRRIFPNRIVEYQQGEQLVSVVVALIALADESAGSELGTQIERAIDLTRRGGEVFDDRRNLVDG